MAKIPDVMKLDAGGKPSTWLPPGETRRALFVSQTQRKMKIYTYRDTGTQKHRHIHQHEGNTKTTETHIKSTEKTRNKKHKSNNI